MEFEHIFKIIVGSLIALVVTGYSSMTKDVSTNKVEINNIKNTIIKMDKKVEEIHWFLLKSKK